jgi:2-pyrone-4,6-dicarboxylate lactonase
LRTKDGRRKILGSNGRNIPKRCTGTNMLDTNEKTVCLRPKTPEPPKRLVVPHGAWDCHAHVIGVPPAYPYVEARHYTPHPASPEDFLTVLDAEGIRHGVVVQVSVHGTDNRYLVEALRRHRAKLFGVAVIDTSTPDNALAEMKEVGVVGIRLLGADGGVGTSDLERLDARCAELGWHIQLCVKGERYPDLLPRLLKLRAPLVIDHMGWFNVEETVQGLSFQAVLDVLRRTDSWLKMAGGFRLSKRGAPYLDTVPFMKELIATAPERLVWGSDWPHVGIVDQNRMPQYGDLLDVLSQATDDDETIKKILIHNPSRLYGRRLS